MLLKERWKLINFGTERKDIRIIKEKLLVHGRLYGSLDPQDHTRFVKDAEPAVGSVGPDTSLAPDTPCWSTDQEGSSDHLGEVGTIGLSSPPSRSDTSAGLGESP